jgi:2-oxoisovalerate dehydrogenase E2 component (dihydrolipoyl transacylase)
MKHIFKTPDLGEGTTQAEIVAWRVKQGDIVREDQPIVDLMTDKATVEVTSPVHGTILELRGEPGQSMPVGSELVVFEVGGERGGVAQKGDPATEDALQSIANAIKAQISAAQAPGAASLKPLASPVARQLAAERGIALDLVKGSGPQGRVLVEDVEAFTLALQGKPAARSAATYGEGIEEIRMVGLRRKIAERMQEAALVAQITYVEELDVTNLETLRRDLNARFVAARSKLTLLPFLMRAIVIALRKYPQCNAHFDWGAGTVRRYRDVHVGLATQTPAGLVVTVARNAQAMDLWKSASEIARLAGSARDGKATRDELSGSTITISSLGALGGIASTPILNAPEVAIVGVNRIVERPMFVGGHVSPRKMMNLSSSFDHRIIDGWDAASFVQEIKTQLERPAMLLLPDDPSELGDIMTRRDGIPSGCERLRRS